MKVIFFVLAVLVPAPAIAAPTYLSCDFVSNGKSSSVQLTADEAAGTVSMLNPTTGFANRMRGTFTPDKVIFGDDLLSYTLSRIDLTVSRTIRMLKSTDTGMCKVQQAPKRAF